MFSFPDHAHCGALTGLLRESAGRLRGLSPRRVRAGEPVYLQGDPTENLYVVLAGRVQTSVVSPGGREYVLGEHGPGEGFGEVCFCEVRARQEQATALEDSEVLAIGPEDLVRFASSGEAAVLELLEMFSHRLADAERRLAELAFSGVRSRVIALLLRTAAGAADAEGFSELEGSLTHDEIARRIPTTREQVSAILSDLRRQRLVDYGRGAALRIRRARLEDEL